MSDTSLAALQEFKFTIDATPENLELLLSQGYTERSGSQSTERKTHYAVLPFRSWFWCETHPYSLHVGVEEVSQAPKYLVRITKR